ncbi:LOW QUALITY PROTEIN: hypothetical protein Cgig2_018710 [Carnegiea gigantea]|uniref:Uncharacterized protein n=1 Tax=Carnegiea gigantea TaxID=171969 RepID=A0A9Q1KFJ9_9CARY|nr:LOW QUALITY PROTEIN: hypothetical protein Cgig2_018710 [Carnegiea gigantea]
MTTTTDTILQQVTEQVKRTMATVNSIRPLPTFDYIPIAGCEPSHKHAPAGSLCRSNEGDHMTKEEWAISGKEPRPLNRGRRPMGSSGDPRWTCELYNYVHSICNSFMVHDLLSRIGANFKALGRNLPEEAHSRTPFSSGAHTQSVCPKSEEHTDGGERTPHAEENHSL